MVRSKETPSKESVQIKLLAAYARFFLNLINLKSFVGVTTTTLEKSKDGIEEEWLKWVRSIVESQEFALMAANKLNTLPKDFTTNFMTDLSGALASRSIRLASQTANVAGIVFAHSVLDGVLSECCSISFAAKPADWLLFVVNRKVDLKELKEQKVSHIKRKYAAEFIRQISRESMLKRFDYLHKVCAPRMKRRELPTAWISIESLEAFDDLRHRIIHGKMFSREVKNFDQQMQFVLRAGLSCLFLVQEAYRVFAKDGAPNMRKFRILRGLAFVKQELPELLEVFKKYTEVDALKVTTVGNASMPDSK